MSDEFLVGLLFGLFTGGFVGILAVAFVTAGSDRGHRASRESSMRVDLLLDLHDADHYGTPSGT